MEVKENSKLTDKGARDYALVKEALKGNQSAYSTLMDLYRNSVYHMVLKMVRSTEDAEDLTLEAFGKAFDRLAQYTPNYAFSTWLFKIASNNTIDFIRKKRIKLISIDSTTQDEEGSTLRYDVKDGKRDPEEEIIQSQKVELMRLIVQKLKPRYRTLVELRYFEEKSYDEISEELDLPLGTVKAQLFRARDALASLLEKKRDGI